MTTECIWISSKIYVLFTSNEMQNYFWIFLAHFEKLAFSKVFSNMELGTREKDPFVHDAPIYLSDDDNQYAYIS